MIVVPIYDGRQKKIDPNKDLPSLHEKLPVWKKGLEDIPVESLAAVGYTVNTFASGSSRQLSFNIQWVVVLGIPKSD